MRKTTYTCCASSGQHGIRTDVDIELVRTAALASLVGGHVRLAKVESAAGGTRVDDLNDDGDANASDGGASHATHVGHLVAGTAIARRATGSLVACDGALTGTAEM